MNSTNNPLIDNDELRRRHLPLALHHANIIQQRKDIEMAILESIEELIDFPTSPDADPAQPSAQDIAAFCRHAIPFQSSDYDAVVEERNIDGRCGYVFCPKHYEDSGRRNMDGSTLRALFGNKEPAKGRCFTLLPNNDVQKWCSPECAKQAMYIKVQISEVPAWERNARQGNMIAVLRERSRDEPSILDIFKNMNISENPGYDELRNAMANLAIERGDLLRGSASAATAANTVAIRENPSTQITPPPQTSSHQPGPSHTSSSMSIEGYTPRQDEASTPYAGSHGSGDEDDEEEEDDDDNDNDDDDGNDHNDDHNDDDVDEDGDWDMT